MMSFGVTVQTQEENEPQHICTWRVSYNELRLSLRFQTLIPLRDFYPRLFPVLSWGLWWGFSLKQILSLNIKRSTYPEQTNCQLLSTLGSKVGQRWRAGAGSTPLLWQTVRIIISSNPVPVSVSDPDCRPESSAAAAPNYSQISSPNWYSQDPRRFLIGVPVPWLVTWL